MPPSLSVPSFRSQVDESFCLRRLLEVVLALGNYLNGATPRGCAHGFKLDSLLKLSTVKAVDNKRTLIHYLAELVQEEEPELLEIVQELQTVKMASRVSMNQIGADHNELLKGHKGLAAQLKAQEGIVDDDTDKFVAEMRPFAEAADKQLNEITTSRKELEEQFEDVVTSFGDTVTMDHGDKTGTEAFFTIVQTFVDNLIDAHTVNEKVKEAAAKVEKMKVNEEKRKNTMLLKRQVRNIRKNSLVSTGGAGAGGSCKAPLWCVCPAAVALPHLLCPVQQANAIRFLSSCPLALLPVLVDALVCSCCCGGGGVGSRRRPSPSSRSSRRRARAAWTRCSASSPASSAVAPSRPGEAPSPPPPRRQCRRGATRLWGARLAGSAQRAARTQTAAVRRPARPLPR